MGLNSLHLEQDGKKQRSFELVRPGKTSVLSCDPTHRTHSHPVRQVTEELWLITFAASSGNSAPPASQLG